MVQSFQNNTKRLKRIAVGCLELGGLPCGEWRELTPREILLAQKRPRELDHKGGLPAGGIPVEKTEQGRFSVKKTLQSGRKNNSSHHHKRSENFSNSSSHTDQYRKNKFYQDIPFMYNVALDAHNNTPVSFDEIISDIEAKANECIAML